MTVILEYQGGTLDKYIGDAIVGIFGAPVRLADHAHRACLAAWRMQCQQAELRARWLAEGERWPPLVHHMRTRIGLHTGTAIVGNMGSTKRFNYTMMGDTVNLAARNESAAKSYGVYIMVSGDTRAMAEAAGSPCVFRFLDRIVVKGRTRPVDVFEIVGEKGELTAAALSCLAAYAEAVEAYLRRDWARAREGFTAAAQFEPHQPDPMRGITINPSLLMLERCAWFAANPPPDDWDGRYIMKSK
jgi:adenylate cyclase